MKKEIFRIMSIGAVVAISWVCGVLVYFANVASYYRKKEQREKDRQHIAAYIDSLGRKRPSSPSVTESRKSIRSTKYPEPADINKFRQSDSRITRYYNPKPFS